MPSASLLKCQPVCDQPPVRGYVDAQPQWHVRECQSPDSAQLSERVTRHRCAASADGSTRTQGEMCWDAASEPRVCSSGALHGETRACISSWRVRAFRRARACVSPCACVRFVVRVRAFRRARAC
eukprot:1037278-Pleurochrysis_carterae.AAC.4